MPTLDATDPAVLRGSDDRTAAQQRLSTRLLFLIVGIANAAWAPLVPLVKDRAGLDAAGLGLLLLTFGIGSILAKPSAGAAAARLGYRPVLLAGTLALGLALPVLALASGLVPLTLALLLFGAGMGAVDCVVNLQAVAVERAGGRPMMSGFHGLYSLGCILGALIASALLAAGLGAGGGVLLLAGGIAALFATAGRQTAMPESMAVTTLGYAGVLAGLGPDRLRGAGARPAGRLPARGGPAGRRGGGRAVPAGLSA